MKACERGKTPLSPKRMKTYQLLHMIPLIHPASPKGGTMSFEIVDGKGPRWIGDGFTIPPELQYAQDLPPKVTDRYVFFFGYDREEKECCLQQWYPSFFAAEGVRFHTAEQYMMYCE